MEILGDMVEATDSKNRTPKRQNKKDNEFIDDLYNPTKSPMQADSMHNTFLMCKGF